MSTDNLILIVGLGNPGERYAQTRHNFGFMCVDAFAKAHGLVWRKEDKFQAMVADGRLHGHKVMLVKPQTFMNLSGESVTKIALFYKVEANDVWVLADDLDLPLGKIRVRDGGATGGHNGLASLAGELGTHEFARIRLGIRGDKLKQEHLDNQVETRAFVTDRFTETEREQVRRVVALATVVVEEALKQHELTAHTYTIDA